MRKLCIATYLIVSGIAVLYAEEDAAKSPASIVEKTSGITKANAAITPGTYSADSIIVKNILKGLLDTIRDVSDVSDSANGRIISLNISGYLYLHPIYNIPPEIGNLNALTSLNLSENGFINLPPQIGNLSLLTYLDISYNSLTSLPPEIGNLRLLTYLNLSNNKLISLPLQIGNLRLLTTFDPSLNNLVSLPAQIGNLNLLTSLDLSNNNLSSLPAQIGNLILLTSVNLSHNNLADLPVQIGNLNLLTSLNLSFNSFTNLPIWVGNLTLLTSLDLSFNSFTNLPIWVGNLTLLTSLDLSQNNLASLPGNIINLKILPPDTVFFNPGPCNFKCTQVFYFYYLNLEGNLLCNLQDSIKNWALKYDPPWLQYQTCASGMRYASKLNLSALLKITQTPSGLLISGTSLPNEDLNLKVISTNGRLIKSEIVHGRSGQLSYVLSKSVLAKGMNIIQISGPNCRYLLHAIVR